MSMNARWISHVILTPLATTQWDRSIANVIPGTKEMEPTAQVRAMHPISDLIFTFASICLNHMNCMNCKIEKL